MYEDSILKIQADKRYTTDTHKVIVSVNIRKIYFGNNNLPKREKITAHYSFFNN